MLCCQGLDTHEFYAMCTYVAECDIRYVEVAKICDAFLNQIQTKKLTLAMFYKS